MTAQKLDDLSSVDEAATVARYGYSGNALAPGSNKKVVARCCGCGAAREVRRYRATATYRCASCAAKTPAAQAKRVTTTQAKYGDGGIWTPERLAAREATTRARYGDAGLRTPEIQQRRQATLDARYGAERAPIVAKIRDAIHEHYGDAGLATPEIQQRRRATLLATHPEGVASDAIQAKRFATLRENYPDGFSPAPTVFSRGAQELDAFLVSLVGRDAVKREVPLATRKRLDFVIPSHAVAIEYCGLYWHHEASKEPRDAAYHHAKWQAAAAEGLQLITLFEDEWRTAEAAVRGFLQARLGVFATRIGARDCALRAVDGVAARAFFASHHIQGPPAQLLDACGLYYQERLVGCVSLSNHHRGGAVLVLSRMCFAPDTQVVGGASRLGQALYERAKARGAPRVITWSDNRWSTGAVYARMGFTRDADLPPDYTYVEVANPKRRLSKQSQKKSATGCPPDLTELEWATQRGLARIWDCGKVRWVREL